MAEKVTVDVTTGVGTLSFPHLFESTKSTNDKGETEYDVQIIIPKTQISDLKAILRAIKTVGEAKFGPNWKKVRNPLRDGDKEADDITEDGTTKGEKYPERLGCYFINARSKKPVGVFDRQRNIITEPSDVYGGCKGKINVTFYPYSNNGNTGIGCALNGVQKISDGESFGGGRPSVESMFDIMDEEDFDIEDDLGEDEDVEPEPAPKRAAKKAAPAAKKAAAPAAKKAAAKKAKPAPVVEEDEDLDDLEDIVGDGEEDDLYDDLDD